MWTGDLGIAWPDTKNHNVLAMGYLFVTFWVGVHCLAFWWSNVRRAWRTGFAPDSVLSRALTRQTPSAVHLARETARCLRRAETKKKEDRARAADLAAQLKLWSLQQKEDAPPFLASALAAWVAFVWHGAVALLVTALWPVVFAPLFVTAYFVPGVAHVALVGLAGWGIWAVVRRYIWKRPVNKT